jgi:hypothetical protein
VAYLGRKRWGDPNFLYAALDAAAYAVPAGRDRMKCAEATKLRRKSGRSPHDRICWQRHSIGSICSCYDTDSLGTEF